MLNSFFKRWPQLLQDMRAEGSDEPVTMDFLSHLPDDGGFAVMNAHIVSRLRLYLNLEAENLNTLGQAANLLEYAIGPIIAAFFSREFASLLNQADVRFEQKKEFATMDQAADSQRIMSMESSHAAEMADKFSWLVTIDTFEMEQKLINASYHYDRFMYLNGQGDSEVQNGYLEMWRIVKKNTWMQQYDEWLNGVARDKPAVNFALKQILGQQTPSSEYQVFTVTSIREFLRIQTADLESVTTQRHFEEKYLADLLVQAGNENFRPMAEMNLFDIREVVDFHSDDHDAQIAKYKAYHSPAFVDTPNAEGRDLSNLGWHHTQWQRPLPDIDIQGNSFEDKIPIYINKRYTNPEMLRATFGPAAGEAHNKMIGESEVYAMIDMQVPNSAAVRAHESPNHHVENEETARGFTRSRETMYSNFQAAMGQPA